MDLASLLGKEMIRISDVHKKVADLPAAGSFNWYIRESEQVTLKAGT